MLHHKKKFGQHFLVNDSVLKNIILLIPPDYRGAIVEVGPGAGALTEPLLKYIEKNHNPFIALEIDDEKVNYLHKKYPDQKNKIVLHDFLETELPYEEFLLIGNFPYNISTQILFKMIEWKEHIPCMIGMFQLEVAERICAIPRTKSYGITSVITQTFYTTELAFSLPPEDFDPPPKVSSAVIKCVRTSIHSLHTPSRYIKFVKAGFAMRRKTLRNNFKGILDPEQLQDSVFDKRAEALSPDEWVDMYKKYREDV